MGRDIVVGTANRYGRTIRGSNPAGGGGGARFYAPVQTGPGAHRSYYAMGTGSFPELKRPGRGVDHSPSSSAEVKEGIKLYLGLRGLF
jgi:hypothetical protein